jgi:acyl carrier protein
LRTTSRNSSFPRWRWKTSRRRNGLGLDSIDALELGRALQKRYGVSLSAESEEVRAHFASVKTLAAFVIAQGKVPEGLKA